MCIVVPYFILAPSILTLFLTLPRGNSLEFLVHSAALQYPHNNTPSEFTVIWNLTLLAMNPNKKWDIYCDSLQASLFYQHITDQDQKNQFVLLAATSLCLLLLTTTNQTLVSFKLPTLNAYVADDVANKISDGNTTDLFGLEISVRYRYKLQSKDVKIPEPDVQSCYCNVPSPSWSIL
ncbi:uncharacterized protein Pyn_18323 [Prunus yedoensis var. nudiflora]|uniref:Uncharacterized protein n=1 Tax=Prunus yedoensis var. nudiflora TaxID=2094558 RepID=A0A314XYA3_PRUYE|nr:uncharacterized protein Pyn_18323 [Prunus yedoensis var. nudiflora]